MDRMQITSIVVGNTHIDALRCYLYGYFYDFHNFYIIFLAINMGKIHKLCLCHKKSVCYQLSFLRILFLVYLFYGVYSIDPFCIVLKSNTKYSILTEISPIWLYCKFYEWNKSKKKITTIFVESLVFFFFCWGNAHTPHT